jgi:putative ABC transport system substrate-binding protein
MATVGDPVRTGLVASLARPGGNITGLTVLGAELGPKRLQLLKEAVPKLSRVAYLWNPNNPANRVGFGDIQLGAKALGVALQSVEIRSADGFGSAFTAIIRERPNALIMTGDPLHQLHVGRIIEFAATHRLPAMYQFRENVDAGGLMSYGTSVPDLFRRAATYVDKILKGARPADLPVEQPTRFELIVNLKTAKALGLTIPPSILLRADQVIQ